jgi:putative photosynthetic complex assembly protein
MSAAQHSPALHHDIVVPRLPLMAVGLMLLATLLAVAVYQFNSDGSSPSQPTAPVVAERLLRFDDQPDGGISVRNALDNSLVQQIPSGAQPFVRGALRALVRERRARGIGAAPPFALQAHRDGRLTLRDTATGRRLDLESFGPTQSAAFAQLLRAPLSPALPER